MNNKQTSRIFFGFVVILTLCGVLYLFKDYLLVIFTGLLLALGTANIQNKFLNLFNGKQFQASLATTAVFCAFFILPFIYGISILASNLLNLNPDQIAQITQKITNYELPSFLQNEQIKNFILSIDFASISKNTADIFKNMLLNTANFIIELGFIIVFFFFSHLYGSKFGQYFKQIFPINTADLEDIFFEISNTMSVVFYSTIANAVFQGFLFALIAWFFGYNGVLFWILFAFASLIPIVGGALIFVPLCLYELSMGNTANSVIILVYCIIIISTLADNFIKPLMISFINEKLLKSPTKMNELLIFFSILAGIGSFGFWGMILGPAIVSLTCGVLKLFVSLKDKNLI